jgi:hypothetical protein
MLALLVPGVGMGGGGEEEATGLPCPYRPSRADESASSYRSRADGGSEYRVRGDGSSDYRPRRDECR